MARVGRTGWLKTTALVVGVASLTINFGLIDLVDGFTGYVDQERNQVLDVGWGAVFGLVLPLSLLAQLRRPERRIAGIQTMAVVAFALALAGAAGEQWRYLALAGGLACACGLLLALHPARRSFLDRGQAIGADDARSHRGRRRPDAAVRASDGLSATASSSARGCCVERSASLDSHDSTRAGHSPARHARRCSHVGLANPRDQRGDCNWGMGDLLPGRSGCGGGQPGARLGMGRPGLGRRNPWRSWQTGNDWPGSQRRGPSSRRLRAVRRSSLSLGILAIFLWALSWSWLIGAGTTVARVGEVGAIVTGLAAVCAGVATRRRAQPAGLRLGIVALSLVVGLISSALVLR